MLATKMFSEQCEKMTRAKGAPITSVSVGDCLIILSEMYMNLIRAKEVSLSLPSLLFSPLAPPRVLPRPVAGAGGRGGKKERMACGG